MRQTLNLIKNFRKIAENFCDYKKNQLFTTVVTTLRRGLNKKKEEEQKVMNDFIGLCATNI